jgi:hypothetical protein
MGPSHRRGGPRSIQGVWGLLSLANSGAERAIWATKGSEQ